MSSITSIFDIAANGMNAATNQFARTAQNIAGPNGVDNLAQNAVDLSVEKSSFKANALVLKTAGQMTGTLLDILDTDKR